MEYTEFPQMFDYKAPFSQNISDDSAYTEITQGFLIPETKEYNHKYIC